MLMFGLGCLFIAMNVLSFYLGLKNRELPEDPIKYVPNLYKAKSVSTKRKPVVNDDKAAYAKEHGGFASTEEN